METEQGQVFQLDKTRTSISGRQNQNKYVQGDRTRTNMLNETEQDQVRSNNLNFCSRKNKTLTGD